MKSERARMRSTTSGGPGGTPAARREEIERRVRLLAVEETRLASAGLYGGAQAAARQRRYWEFMSALLAAPLPPRSPRSVH